MATCVIIWVVVACVLLAAIVVRLFDDRRCLRRRLNQTAHPAVKEPRI